MPPNLARDVLLRPLYIGSKELQLLPLKLDELDPARMTALVMQCLATSGGDTLNFPLSSCIWAEVERQEIVWGMH